MDPATVTAAPDLLTGTFGDEVVVLSLESGTYYGLQGVAARIWSHLQQPISVLALRDAIVDEFDVDAQQCEDDLHSFLDEMIAKGLVSRQEIDTGPE